MKTIAIAVILLGAQLAYGQNFNSYMGQDNNVYHVITINPVKFGQGGIFGEKGNKIAAFHAAIRSWVFKDGMQTFLDKNDKPLAQIRYENNQANLYDNAGQLVHTFKTDPNLPAKSYITSLTKSDDIIMLNPKTHEIVDSYNFRVKDLSSKIPNPDDFSSLSSYMRIVYDTQGNFVQTVALDTHFFEGSVVKQERRERRSVPMVAGISY